MTRFAFRPLLPFKSAKRSQTPWLTQSQDTPTRFCFLLLPAEIRNKIYRNSLVEDPSANRIRVLVQPPLLRTNKQIRSEALAMYYGENRFVLYIPRPSNKQDPDAWPNFIRMFRVFKAGGTGGRGTGSLRFVRDMQFRLRETIHNAFWQMRVTIEAVPTRGEGNDLSTVSRNGLRLAEGAVTHFWLDRESLREYFERELLLDDELPWILMNHQEYLRRMTSTVLMVTSESIEFTDGVQGHVWTAADRRLRWDG